MGLRNLIPAEHGRTLPAALFEKFERRPVNYYRDVFAEEERNGGSKLSEEEFNARVEELLAGERERIRIELQKQAEERFEAGLAQGRQVSAAEGRRAVELLTHYAQVLQAEKQELAARAEREALELAFQLARKIIGDEIASRPEVVKEVARNALRQVLDCDQIRLRVNADDYDYLNSVQGELQSMLSKSVSLEIRVDGEVERGGCLVETERGSLDARIGSQLETLRSALREQHTGQS